MHGNPGGGRWLWRLPRLALLLFVIALAALLWLSERAEREDQRAALINDMLWLEQNVHFHLTRNEELLAQTSPANIRSAASFEPYARALLNNETGLVQVLWLKTDGAVVYALPVPGDLKPAEDDPETAAAFASRRLAESLGKPAYSPPYTGLGNEWRFRVHVPVFHGGHLAGIAVGVYAIDRMLEKLVPWWLTERYRISVISDGGTVLGSRSKIAAPEDDNNYQMPFDPPGHGLVFQAIPYRAATPLIGRLLSIALIFLALLVLWSLWALRRHVQKRLAAELALREEHAFRRAMEDSLQTALRARDLEGRITYVNPAFCRMFGWSAEELVGRRPPMPYWVDEAFEETKALHDKILAGEGPEQGFEIDFKRRNGEKFTVLIHEAPLIDTQGRQTGWMSSLIDVSDQKRAAEQVRQQQERLQATARLVTMGEMASTLAHELNQPLAAIASYNTGCLNLIASGNPNLTEIESALAKSLSQAQRAGHIIHRIYDFVRRSDPKTETCHIPELLEEVIDLIGADAARLKVRIVTDIPGKLPALTGDRVMLGQVIFNLIRNAIDSMRETYTSEATVRISANLEDSAIHLQIADRGCGVSFEVAQQLFQPFFTTKAEGMGMGLAICRTIVESHRGRLWFEANPGGGSIFHLLLPTTP